MRAIGWIACGLGPALLLCGMRCPAQAVPAADTTAELYAMSQQADVIFAGRVIAVRPGDGVVAIDFAVDDAVRGVRGGTYTLHEWAGLWGGGAQPLHVGQRYLMLLHGSGASGLGAPVGGADGAIPIRGGEDGLSVDLRWVQTRVVRPVQYRRTEQLTGVPSALHPEVARGALADAIAPSPLATTAAAQYAAVLTMLRAWEKAQDGAR